MSFWIASLGVHVRLQSTVRGLTPINEGSSQLQTQIKSTIATLLLESTSITFTNFNDCMRARGKIVAISSSNSTATTTTQSEGTYYFDFCGSIFAIASSNMMTIWTLQLSAMCCCCSCLCHGKQMFVWCAGVLAKLQNCRFRRSIALKLELRLLCLLWFEESTNKKT